MRRDLTAHAAASLLTIAAAIMLLLSDLVTAGTISTVLRIAGGIPLVLVLPGYALSALLLPHGVRPVYISAALWHGMWTVGLSLATAVLGGLLLNLLPSGLTRTSWTIMLAGTTLVALGTGALLRIRRFPAVRPGSPVPGTGPLYPASLHRRTARALNGQAMVYSVAAVLAVGAAIWLAAFTAARQQPAGFAQLWLVPAANGTGRATVGVRNDYARTQRFHVVLRRGTQTVSRWDMELATGKTWTTAVSAPATESLSAELTTAGERTSPQVVTLHQGVSRPAPSPSPAPPSPSPPAPGPSPPAPGPSSSGSSNMGGARG